LTNDLIRTIIEQMANQHEADATVQPVQHNALQQLGNRFRGLPHLQRLACEAAVCLTAGLSVFAGAWDSLDGSGQYEHFYPSKQQVDPITNQVTILSENEHGIAAQKAPALRRAINRYHANYVLLQEVTTDDAAKLHRDFPSWHVLYVLADRREHYADGGYGNVMMSLQGPHQVTTKTIPGISETQTATRLLEAGPADAASGAFSFTAWQENRAAIAMTTQATYGDKTIDIRIIDGHISDKQVTHKQQLREFTSFIGHNTKPGRPTFVCADFNGRKHEIHQALAKYGFVTPKKHSTRNTHNGDFCAINTGGLAATMHVEMITDFHTDHYPNLATTTFPAPTVTAAISGAFTYGTFK
jgi:hypothetical protein